MRTIRFLAPLFHCTLFMVAIASQVRAQTTGRSLLTVLEQPIQPTAVTAYQLQKYLMTRIPKLPAPMNSEQWRAQEAKLRKHILDDVAFHGWPPEWVNAAPQFEEVDVTDTGKGYRLHKLRYQIVPGYQSTAILYEPARAEGRVPAILNVHGHEPMGKAAEYKQKRCINFAKRGIYALSLEWMGFGELAQPENRHDYGAHLDLVGANALGFFYLAMRRGLDYLTALPHVDPKRLGVTGLSGGGWQTIVLSALDDRVAVAVEVAGFGSLEFNLTHPVDTDEIEEDATDLTDGQDYSTLVAMRAPRPTLLIHNAEDDCCFRAALVKPYIHDRIVPFFKLLGEPEALGWHENRDPGTHNYQLDNRQQAYRFFTQHFGLPVTPEEIESDDEIRSPAELTVGLSPDNLTIGGLARKLGQQVTRPSAPAEGTARTSWVGSERERLRGLIRYAPVTVTGAWRIWNTKHQGVETLSYRFDFSNGLSATGLWLKGIAVPANAPATIVLNDKGRKAAGEMVSQLVNRGQQVLALDVLFNGETIPQQPDPTDWEMLVAAAGDRPIGLEAAQLLGVANWFRGMAGSSQVRVETAGIRSQALAVIAAALDPSVFSEVTSSQGMHTLGYLLDIPFRSAPELYCLDLYKYFDLDLLAAMGAPVKMTTIDYAHPPAQTSGE